MNIKLKQSAPKEGLKNFTADQILAYLKRFNTLKMVHDVRTAGTISAQEEAALSKFDPLEMYEYVRAIRQASTAYVGSRLVQLAMTKCKELVIQAAPIVQPAVLIPAVTTASSTTTTTTTTTTNTTTVVSVTTTSTVGSTATATTSQQFECDTMMSVDMEKGKINYDLYRGFPVVPTHAVQPSSQVGLDTLLAPLGLVKLAVGSADLLFLEKGSWMAKPFGVKLIKSAAAYQEAATRLALFYNSNITLEPENAALSIKGMLLVDWLMQYFSRALSGNRHTFMTFVTKASTLMIAHTTYSIANRIGDCTRADNPLEYTKKVLEACRAIRGGDKSDSTPLGTAYYLGVAVPRPIAKAFILFKDMLNLIYHYNKCSGIFFVGTGSNKLVQQIALIGLWQKSFGGACAPPVNYKPTADNENVFTRQGSAAKFYNHEFKDCLRIYLDQKYTPNTKMAAFRQELDFNTYNNFLPSCAIHSLQGYVMNKQCVSTPDKIDVWLSIVREINVQRTFSAGSMSYKLLAQKFHHVLANFVIKDTNIATCLRNIQETYDQSLLEDTLISDIKFDDINQFQVEYKQAFGDKPVSDAEEDSTFVAEDLSAIQLGGMPQPKEEIGVQVQTSQWF